MTIDTAETIHETFVASDELRVKLAEKAEIIKWMSDLAIEIQNSSHGDGAGEKLYEFCEKKINSAKQSLQIYPVSFNGVVEPCLALKNDTSLDDFVISKKDGLTYTRLMQPAFDKLLGEEAIKEGWKDMLQDSGRRFRTVPDRVLSVYPNNFNKMTLFEDENRLIKLHTIQPEINTRTGPQYNPDWLASGGGTCWTLSVKDNDREAFKIAMRDGKPYVIPFNPLSPYFNAKCAKDLQMQAFGDAHYRLH